MPISNGYLFLQDKNPNNELWILNATGNLENLASNSNIALSNSVYGVSVAQSHNTFMKTWLAYIGYIMSIVLVCLHAIFIGNDLLYKVDNTLILAQALYFISFVQLLVGQLLVGHLEFKRLTPLYLLKILASVKAVGIKELLAFYN